MVVLSSHYIILMNGLVFSSVVIVAESYGTGGRGSRRGEHTAMESLC